MGFLRNLFSRSRADGEALALSPEMANYAQIALLGNFETIALPHPQSEHRFWNRVLPRSYEQELEWLCRQEWMTQQGEYFQLTEEGQRLLAIYQARMAASRSAAMEQVRQALSTRDASSALDARRSYEALHPPLGKAAWTGPEPQMSHSALTRRILFLDHWLLDGLSQESADWLRLVSAEQHLWGAYWQLEPTQIPPVVLAELQAIQPPDRDASRMPGPELVYWRAYQLALYVDNQETWQRCKGGDHVRRIRMVNPYAGESCEHCRQSLDQEFLVTRTPELPHRDCTSPRGCLCQYEPVLDMYEEESE